MKVSKNFVAQEFVPPEIFSNPSLVATWFINQRCVELAEFYKEYFTAYYKKKYGSDKVKTVLIIINDWHTGGVKKDRGFRTPDCTEGGKLSQHRFKDAFDCDIIIVFASGERIEADYREVQKEIIANEKLFMAKGLTAIEDPEFALTWLHSDCRWIINQTSILIVKPKSK